jgi:hypothetical protein
MLGVVWLFVDRVTSGRESTRHQFDVDSTREFLTDEDAKLLAGRTMVAEGYDMSEWHPLKASPTTSPAGEKDIFLYRNSLNPRAGFVIYIDGESGRQTRHVEIDFSSGRATTYILIPK